MVQFNPENANVAPLRQIVSFWTEKAVYRVSSKYTTSKDLFLLSVSLTSKQRVKGRRSFQNENCIVTKDWRFVLWV